MVYKFLENNNMAPNILYKYVRGLNTPDFPEEDSCIYNKYDDFYIYSEGWLHAFKYSNRREIHKSWLRLHIVVMFIPKGCKYHDAGIAPKYLQDCTNHIISKELYWPKDWFDYVNGILNQYSKHKRVKIKGWVARETDGSLWLFNEKPSRRDCVAGGDMWFGPGFFPLENLYPELSCNDDPIEVELTIKKI